MTRSMQLDTRRFTSGLFSLAAVACGLMIGTALAQSRELWPPERPDAAAAKDTILLRRTLADLTTAASGATFRLLNETADGEVRDAALAAAVSPDGLLVTKASELGPRVLAVVPAPGDPERRLAVRLVGFDPEYDVAVVRVALPEGEFVETVEFIDAEPPAAGAWLVTVAADPDGPGGDVASPVAIGNVSVAGTREIGATGQQLGISMAQQGAAGIPVTDVTRGGAAAAAGIEQGDLIVARDGAEVRSRGDFVNRLRFDRPDETFVLTVLRGGDTRDLPVRLRGGRLDIQIAEAVAGVVVQQALPGSPAEEAGIRFGDLITAVDGEIVTGGDALRQRLLAKRAGERVAIELIRAGQPVTLTTQLGDSGRGLRARLQNALGGTSPNRRASDFPAVIQHDTVLASTSMGGPVVDLAGRVVGINIARAGRVESYALPAGVLRDVVARLAAEEPQPGL